MKISDRFRVQLLKRALKLGFNRFLKTALSMLLSLRPSPIVTVFGYSRDCRDGVRFTGYTGKGVDLRNFTTWEKIPSELKMFLVEIEEPFENVIKQGWRLWIGTIGNQVAIFMWTRPSSRSTDFFFPIGERSVLFWQAETLPAYRGMNLLPLLFDYIAQTLKTEGIHTMYATCATFNLASRRVFEKTNFRLIGWGLMLPRSGRGMVWIPSKKMQESKVSV